MAIHSNASIWLSTRIIPISAHIAEPERPITINAVSTGPSSRIKLKPTAEPKQADRAETNQSVIKLQCDDHADK